MMKQRKLGIALLLMLAVVVTTGTFAYWASSVTGDTSDTSATASVVIGEGNAASTTVTFGTVGDDGSTALVPTSQGSNDTIVFTISVSWDSASGTTADGAIGTLSIADTYVLTGLTDAEIDAMFDVTYSFDSTITAGDASDTVVTVTLVFAVEPADKATYDLVATKTLQLDLDFTVTPN